MNTSDIEVIINNFTVNYVQSIEIVSDIRKAFDWFKMKIVYNTADKDILAPFLYSQIVIKYKSKTVFTGIVEALSKTAKQRTIVLSGRSKAAFLTDCDFTSNYTFKETKLNNIVKQICSDYGVDVKTTSYDSEEFEKVNFVIGKNIFTQLADLASLTALNSTIPLLSSNANGELVVGKNIVINNNPVATFIKDEVYFEMRVSFDGTKRKYKYKTFAQTMKNVNIESLEVFDTQTNLTKKMQYSNCDGASINECNNRAKYERAVDISNSNNIEIAAVDWLDKYSNVFETGTLVSVKNEDCMIFNETTFLIERVRFSYGEKILNAQLKLTPKDTYKV